MIALWVGLELTIYGMALVFLLLGLLWGAIALLVRFDQPSSLVEREAEPAAPAERAGIVRGETTAIDPELLSAIVIACRAHRMTRRKQAAPEMRTHQPGTLPSRWVGAGRTRQNRSWAPGGRYA